MSKKIILLILFLLSNSSQIVFASVSDCSEFKKFSSEYFKCKVNLIKEKAISTSKDIIKDTKDYQNQEWSKEKEKILKTKEKILDQ